MPIRAGQGFATAQYTFNVSNTASNSLQINMNPPPVSTDSNGNPVWYTNNSNAAATAHQLSSLIVNVTDPGVSTLSSLNITWTSSEEVCSGR